MDRPMRRHAILAAVALAAFIWLMAVVMAGRTLPFDLQVRSRIHDVAVDPLTTAMSIITSFGSLFWLLPAAIAAFVLLRRQGHSQQALVVAVVLLGSIPIENALKRTVQRQRPAAFFNVPLPETYSFPSGHAFFSTSFYGVLGYVSAQLAKSRTQRAIIWLSTISSIGVICLSRVYLGVHYPTDVAGGVLIACFWMNTVLMFVKLR